jgi:hypothetical protein
MKNEESLFSNDNEGNAMYQNFINSIFAKSPDYTMDKDHGEQKQKQVSLGESEQDEDYCYHEDIALNTKIVNVT